MGWITEELWLNFQQGQDTFLSFRASKSALWPNQPHIQWVPGVPSPAGRADHSPSMVRKKNSYTPMTSGRVWGQLNHLRV